MIFIFSERRERKRYNFFGETSSHVSVSDDFDMVYVSCFGEDCMSLMYSSLLYDFSADLFDKIAMGKEKLPINVVSMATLTLEN